MNDTCSERFFELAVSAQCLCLYLLSFLYWLLVLTPNSVSLFTDSIRLHKCSALSLFMPKLATTLCNVNYNYYQLMSVVDEQASCSWKLTRTDSH